MPLLLSIDTLSSSNNIRIWSDYNGFVVELVLNGAEADRNDAGASEWVHIKWALEVVVIESFRETFIDCSFMTMHQSRWWFLFVVFFSQTGQIDRCRQSACWLDWGCLHKEVMKQHWNNSAFLESWMDWCIDFKHSALIAVRNSIPSMGRPVVEEWDCSSELIKINFIGRAILGLVVGLHISWMAEAAAAAAFLCRAEGNIYVYGFLSADPMTHSDEGCSHCNVLWFMEIWTVGIGCGVSMNFIKLCVCKVQ